VKMMEKYSTLVFVTFYLAEGNFFGEEIMISNVYLNTVIVNSKHASILKLPFRLMNFKHKTPLFKILLAIYLKKKSFREEFQKKELKIKSKLETKEN
jgi:hypothetical protein